MGRLIAPVLFFGAMMILALIATTFNDKPISSSSSQVLMPYAKSIETPPATVKDANGGEYQLGKLGDGGLVVFWSSTCGECQTQLKDLREFIKNNSSFKAILVNIRQTVEIANNELTNLGVTLPNYYDDGTAFKEWSGTMPSSYYIIDGTIRYFFPGRISAEHLTALKN